MMRLLLREAVFLLSLVGLWFAFCLLPEASRELVAVYRHTPDGRALLQILGPGRELAPYLRFGGLAVLAMASAALLALRLVAMVPIKARRKSKSARKARHRGRHRR